MVSFATDSTFHGIKFIFGPFQSFLSRIFWLFWFSLSILGFAYFIHGLVANSSVEHEKVVKVKEKPASDFPFPAVTVCSPVFAKHSKVEFRMSDEPDDKMKPYTKKECEYVIANSHWCQKPNIYVTNYHCPEDEQPSIDVVKLINESSLNPGEILQNVPYRRFIDSNEEFLTPLAKFDKVLTDQGFCYTTNLQNHHVIFKDDISKDFDSYKRKIILKTSNAFIINRNIEEDFNDTEQWTLHNGYPTTDDETFPVRAMRRHSALILPKLDDADASNVCNEQQFSLIFHLPNEIPTPLHKSYPLQFGNMKKFRVSVTSQQSDNTTRSLSIEERGCYFEDERRLKFFKTYTKAHCDWECMTKYVLETCGCVKFSMPRSDDTPVCTLLESKCYIEAVENWPNNSSVKFGTPCGCLPTCSDIKFDVEVEVDSNLNKRQKEKFTSYAEIGVGDFTAVVRETSIVWKKRNFVAEVGGYMALFLGCSILSFIELIYFALAALWDLMCKPPQKKTSKVHAFIERPPPKIIDEKPKKEINEKKPKDKKQEEIAGLRRKMRKVMRCVTILQRKNKNEVVKIKI